MQHTPPPPAPDPGQEWTYIIKMMVHQHKLTAEQYKDAYKKREALKNTNSQHLIQFMYELGYVKYDQFAEFVVEIFKDQLDISRGHSSHLVSRKDDEQIRYFNGDAEVSPCFYPVLTEMRPQVVLTYDDYVIMLQTESTDKATEQKSGHKDVNFTFEVMARDAANQGASDIHIVPKEHYYYVFFRKNGDLIEQSKYMLDIESGWELVTQIKLDAAKLSKGNFKADKHLSPQDARVVYGDIDLRLAFIPDGVGGHRMSVVARVIKKTVMTKPDLLARGFHLKMVQAVLRSSQLDGGLITISGITGSGKTTFLGEVLALIDTRRRILTIEDPVEVIQSNKNITQHQIFIPPDEDEDRMGYSEFAKIAKRSDPNVVSIGEMRKDPELSDMVFEMAYAGQLVYTTIHIRSCFEVFHALQHVFMLDLESVVPLVFLSVNMKLTKKLCDCKHEDKDGHNRTRIEGMMEKFKYEHKVSAQEFLKNKEIKTFIRNPQGCQKCNFTGYSGRIPMYEYFEPNIDLVEYILKDKPTKYQIEKFVCSRNLGQNRLETFIQRMIDGEVDTSPEIFNAIL